MIDPVPDVEAIQPELEPEAAAAAVEDDAAVEVEPAVEVDGSADMIPAELRDRPGGWTAGDARDKRPMTLQGSKGERSGHWHNNADDFGEVVAHIERAGDANLRLGIVFHDECDITGIDLDKVRHPETGEVVPWAQAIVELFASYTEISESGTGFHIIVRGPKPDRFTECEVRGLADFKGGTSAGIEVYDHGRWFLTTGDVYQGRVELSDSDPLEELFDAQFAASASGAPDAVPPATGNSTDEVSFKAALPDDYVEDIRGALACIPNDDDTPYDKWLKIGFALRSTHGGEQAFGLWREWSERSSKFNGHTQRKAWNAMKEQRPGRTNINIETVFHLSKEGGYVGTATAEPTEQDGADDDAENSDLDAEGEAAKPGDRDPYMEQAAKRKRLKKPKAGFRHGDRLVLDPKRTMPTAEAFVREHYTHEDGDTLYHYAELFLHWRDGRWREKEHGTLRHEIQPWQHDAWTVNVRHDDVGEKNEETGKKEPGDWQLEWTPFICNSGSIRGALSAVEDLKHIVATAPMPSWIGGDAADQHPANEILPCKSTLLHIPTRETQPATPRLFATNGIDFDYDPEAPRPERWLAFLQELCGDDQEAVELLQEFFGYVLTMDTSQQKALLIVGPKRSGKGTIARVLRKLVGCDNVCGPTVTGLAGSFGLQPLIGKPLAIVSDARFHGLGVPIVVERLLNIIGEDAITIDRKHVSSVTMKLPTRFVFLTNELPQFTDAAAALPSRFMILYLDRSFYGKEDNQLTDKLLAELPGILHWALDGWQRLRERGRFHMPASSKEHADDLGRMSSAIGAFVEDCCELGGAHRATVDEMFLAWKQWCECEGRDRPGNKQRFGRDLKAAVPKLKRRRGTGDKSFYEGVRLLTRDEWRAP
jgi:putative DNA primase/helicase